MNEHDFKKLAQIRLEDARILLNTGQNPSGAYYLAGYAVECALKACIAKNVKAGDWPPKPDDVRKMYSHDLHELVKQANLAQPLNQELKKRSFAGNWGTVKDWSEQKRYEICSQAAASALIGAIEAPADGVLAWIQQFW